MKRCLIVDDEKPAREELLHILNEIKGVEVVAEASNGIEALELNKKLKPDIIFLDIQMPEISGLDVASKLMEEETAPIIIFVTAYDEFAIDAFEVNATDYLLKPISEDRLKSRLDKIIEKSNRDLELNYNQIKELIESLKISEKDSPRLISLYHENKLVPVELEDIVYATIEDKNTVIISGKEKFKINTSLNRLLDKLDSSMFFRTHKSYIVNLNKIESVETWFNGTYNINLIGYKEKIPVSRNAAGDFKKVMNIEN